MLIDSLDVKYSGNVANKVVSGPDQIKFINAWHILLSSVGWTQVAALHASVSVTFPLGCPISDGIEEFPKTVVGCNAPPGFLTIGAQEYSLYDPYKQIPGSSTACIFVPMGTSFDDTFENLSDAINGGLWVAVITKNTSVNYTLDLTAISAGPEFNELLVTSNGFLSGNAVTAGGGWTMRSSGDNFSAVYDCTMTAADRDGAGDNYLAGLLKFDFSLNGQHTSYQLLNDVQGTLGFMGALGVGAVAQYTIIANPYGFTVFAGPRDANTHLFRSVSLFVMAPYFPVAGMDVPPTENFVPAYAVFIVGPNQVGGSVSWNNQFMSGSAWMLDGDLVTRDGFNPTPRVLTFLSPTLSLQTRYNVPIYLGAYVQFGTGAENTDPAWVVGKLWDCAVVQDYVSTNGAILDGKQFLTLGFGNGADSNVMNSFMMVCGLPSRSGFVPIGQSARCASAPGSPGEAAYDNTGH